MLLKKEGFPEEDELVLCTITAVQFHSVFVNLDEYGRSGLIHISEIAPGRIRNIRDYVVEGKKVVCKVLRINQQKGHIDLSLRRVNEAQKKNKLNQIKQEQLSERIIEFVAKQNKQKLAELYDKIAEKVLDKYPTMFEAFEAVVSDTLDLSKVIDAKLAKQLTELIKQRIKPPEVEIGGEIALSCHEPNGVELIKEALKTASETKGNLTIKYKGTGNYNIWIKSEDYKSAEKVLKKSLEALEKFTKKNKIKYDFKRIEKS
ncbi:translation initiation factor IF-2 subunit alpha [Candidatus Woesearchaeota archaeon]|nr:translation initiation factor IF-2 subunit alpha [Candidatus Woesearchaeota archaeon]MBW2994023.1 translation initiation factor IF-2 subunit alpha [Candidatus Woesearchaeota archaeon]